MITIISILIVLGIVLISVVAWILYSAVVIFRNTRQSPTVDNMCEPVTECKRGQHVWVWKEMSPGGLYNIWQCQKCKAQKTISVFDT